MSMLEHIFHICSLCSTDKIRQFWHVVQNCSTENVCGVCEKYDVYAEDDFFGDFPKWATPPPPFWEFRIGKNFPFLSMFLRPVLPTWSFVPYVSPSTGAFCSLDRTVIDLLATRWATPRQHKIMVTWIESSILWDRTQKRTKLSYKI